MRGKVYLDIDGVMVHADPRKAPELDEDGFYKFNAEAVKTFNSFCWGYDIVLTSSHNRRFDKRIWTELLRRRGLYFRRLYIPKKCQKLEGESRKDFIQGIIDKDGAICHRVVIDDDKSISELNIQGRHHIIVTNPISGLVMEDLMGVTIDRELFLNVAPAILGEKRCYIDEEGNKHNVVKFDIVPKDGGRELHLITAYGGLGHQNCLNLFKEELSKLLKTKY